MEGLPNLGATCWLNALVQCMRVSREWNETSDDPFTFEFLKLMRKESDNTTHFLKHLPMNPFGDGPNDSQEALVFILDRLEKTIQLSDFNGEVTQTVFYPGGKSITKNPCTVWFNQEKDDTIQDYIDAQGNKYNVAIVRRNLTKIPKILLSDVIRDELFDKKLTAVVHWGFGHYVALVKKDGKWYCVNDMHVSEISNVSNSGYVGFYI